MAPEFASREREGVVSTGRMQLPALQVPAGSGLEGPDASHEFTASIEDLVESLMTNEKPHRNAVCKQFL